jgi:hypothetical protein
MTGLWSKLYYLRQNKDFYGNKVYDPDSSPWQKTKDVAGFMNPNIAFQSVRAMQEAGTTGAGSAALSSFGFNKAPWWVDKTPAQMLISESARRLEEGKDKETAETSRIKKETLTLLRQGTSWANLPDDLKSSIVEKTTPTQRARWNDESKMQPDDVGFKYLDANKAVKVWKVADEEEKLRWKKLFVEKITNHVADMNDEQKKNYLKKIKEELAQ